MDWKERIRDLSTSLNNLGSLKNIQRMRRPSAPAPLWMFFGSQNSSDWCLSLVFFPFNPFGLAGALKNYILGALDLRTIILDFSDRDLSIFCSCLSLALHLNCKRRNFVALRGGGSKFHRNTAWKSKKTRTCESKAACKFSKKLIPEGFKSRFDTVER